MRQSVDSAPAYLRISQASDRSGVSRSRLYLLMADGRVRAKKDGGNTLVEWASLLEYLDALPAAEFGAARHRAAA